MVSLDVDKKQVEKAVKALNKYVQKRERKDITSDIETQEIQLQIGFKKIPRVQNKIISVTLPNSVMFDTSDVCLMVKDLDKKKRDHEPTVDFFQDLLQKHGVESISQIIPLKQIKLEYQPYEAKRNLSNMYDKFLADERIVRLLPGLLGKSFYGRKRYPIQVNLNAKDLKKEIERALSKSQCIISGRGSTCQVTVAHSAMAVNGAVENVLTAVQKIAECIPGGESNVKNMHLKTVDSPSLPIYVSSDSVNEVELPPKPNLPPLDEPEEVTTVLGAKVRVTPHGKIHVIKDKAEPLEANEVDVPDATEADFDTPEKLIISENMPIEILEADTQVKKGLEKPLTKRKLKKEKKIETTEPIAKIMKTRSTIKLDSPPPSETKRKRKVAKAK